MDDAQKLIAALGLEPLEQEGGMVRRFWDRTEPGETRSAASAIYYLLSGKQFSHLHRLTCDEVYSFLSGDPLELLEITAEGKAIRHVLGPDPSAGQEAAVPIGRGSWQGSRVLPGGSFSLVTTVCVPGYENDSYEHCLHHAELSKKYPEYEELIAALCPEE